MNSIAVHNLSQQRQLRAIKIRIDNPVRGGMAFTSAYSAQVFVARGEAEWSNKAQTGIRFLFNKLRRVKGFESDRAVHATRATLEQIAGLPACGDPAKVYREGGQDERRCGLRQKLEFRQVYKKKDKEAEAEAGLNELPPAA